MKDGNLIKEPNAIVENLNNFFINIGPNLVRNININPNTSFQTYLTKHIISLFHFSLVNENEVNKILKSLRTKTSSGHEGISVKLLRFLSPALLRPLPTIINQLLITGLLPIQLKVAKLIPIHNKDEKFIMDNYRPAFLLSSIPQVFEKVAYNQLYAFLTTSNIFYEANTHFEKTFYRIS